MAPIPAGVYTISHSQGQLVTLEDGSANPGAPVLILASTGHPQEQEWSIQAHKNATISIINLESGTYLSYEGKPEENKLIGGYPDVREWALYPSSEPLCFYVVVPGGPVKGKELALDMSVVKKHPPQMALRPLERMNLEQAWKFGLHE